jgi:hypothetical protein
MKILEYTHHKPAQGIVRLECGHTAVVTNRPVFEAVCPVCEPNKTMFAVSQDSATQRQVLAILVLNKMRKEGVSV